MAPVRKAVIPAAGLGTRFLPITKSVPKELLPIVDRPLISFAVEEAIAAGAEEIIFVVSPDKPNIDGFFKPHFALEKKLQETQQNEALASLKKWSLKADFKTVVQTQPLGLGHAVLTAQPEVKDPFFLLLPDELFFSAPGVSEQLRRHAVENSVSTVAVMPVPTSKLHRYGVIGGEPLVADKSWRVTRIVEKPKPEQAPSNWSLPGRYVLTPEVFEDLQSARPSSGGEIQLTTALQSLAERSRLHALAVTAERYDAGDKLGFLQANIAWGLRQPALADELKKYLHSLR